MKRIILVCDVKDEDVDEVVKSAKEALPTWRVNVKDPDSLKGYYRARLYCSNCHHIWFTLCPQGVPLPKKYTCPNCMCETGR